jgi:hypothetical protein
MWLFPLAAAVVSGTFSGFVGSQFWRRRRPNLLAWATALAMFAIASAAATIGMATGWTPAWFRVYYLFGAIVNVPVLGLGTIYLLVEKRVAHVCAMAVLVASVIATIAVFHAGLKPGAARALATNGIPAGHSVMPTALRMMARYYSFVGFFVVVGGALWSARRLARQRQDHLKRLALANGFIAGGTFVVALGSGFAFYGQGWPFALGLLVGVTMMFWGFLKTRPTSRRRAA